MKSVTIKDVANLSGVSTATVSLVLNNRPAVSHKTALRVREAISSCGYEVPAPTNRQRKRTKNVTLVMLGMPKHMLFLSIYAEFMFSLEEALRSNNCTLHLRNAVDASSLKDLAKNKNNDGIVLIYSNKHDGNDDSEEPTKHIWRSPGVEALGQIRSAGFFDHIAVDNRAISSLAADYLYKHGHRHSAYFGQGTGMFSERCRVFCDRVRELGGTAAAYTSGDLLNVTKTGHVVAPEIFNSLMDEMLYSNPRPTGLMIEADTMALPIYQYLFQRGVIPGKDIEVVTVNNERRIIAGLHPQPAVIDIHAELIAQRVAEQLLWRIDNPTAPRVTTIVAPELILPANS